VGYTFPGVDPKKVNAARASKKADEDVVEAIIPEPKMDIGPMSSNGVILIDFN
jgi:hypothetical protein